MIEDLTPAATATAEAPRIAASSRFSILPPLRQLPAKGATALLYSGSRLGLSVSLGLFIPFILRLCTAEEANRLLIVFAGVAFASNLLSAWLEQIVYRFPLSYIKAKVRLALLIEAVGLLSLLIFYTAAFPGIFTTKPFSLLLAYGAVMVLADLTYRVGAACLQVTCQDRLYICQNICRISLELLFGTCALLVRPTATTLLLALASARVLSLLSLLQTSPLYRPSPIPTSGSETSWLGYGFSMFVWLVSCQILFYLPQAASILFQSATDNIAFLSSYRLVFQTAMLVPAALLLYVHPKLFACLQTQGQSAFLILWRKWLSAYLCIALLGIFCLALSFPFVFAPLLTARYAPHSAAILLTLPGVLCWAVANYFQKLIEVGNSVGAMAHGLAYALSGFILLLAAYVASRGSTDRLSIFLANDISFSLACYLLAVTRFVARQPIGKNSIVTRALKYASTAAFVMLFSYTIAITLCIRL